MAFELFLCVLVPRGRLVKFTGKKGKRRDMMSNIDNQVGFMVHKLDMGVKRILDAKMKAAGYDEVTMMHGWILKYLYDNRDREVYQRDIEKQFSIGRSTVTTIIQLMEKRDLICRQSVDHDARLKRVMLNLLFYQRLRFHLIMRLTDQMRLLDMILMLLLLIVVWMRIHHIPLQQR
jgi:hypothetical protein